MRKIADLTNKKFGDLIVISEHHRKNGVFWLCLCICGRQTIVRGNSLNYGSTKSCGCGSKKTAIHNCLSAAQKRILPFKNVRKLKDLYKNMRNRCCDPLNKRYKNYGGRGIKVCDEWLNDRIGFYKWASENGFDIGMSIERRDVNGNYEPSNCCFIPMLDQQKNTTRSKFLEWGGEKLTIAEWARKLGVKQRALQHRVARDWPLERIFNQPFRNSPTK
jgi:hypothetical protein